MWLINRHRYNIFVKTRIIKNCVRRDYDIRYPYMEVSEGNLIISSSSKVHPDNIVRLKDKCVYIRR